MACRNVGDVGAVKDFLIDFACRNHTTKTPILQDCLSFCKRKSDFYLFGVWNKSDFQDFGSEPVCMGTALAICSINVRKRGRYQTLDVGEVESNETKFNSPRARDVMPMKVRAVIDVAKQMLVTYRTETSRRWDD